jgi:hypothetical protein
MITDWKITPVNWARSLGDQAGVSKETIRDFASRQLFPYNHNVGMLVVAKDNFGGKGKIEGMTWDFETDPILVHSTDVQRMNNPQYPRYRVWKGEISDNLPCTLPVDRRNIQKCIESLSDEELTQMYEDIKTADFLEYVGVEQNFVESAIVYPPTNTLYTFLLVTGKQYFYFPAINANIEQIRKT